MVKVFTFVLASCFSTAALASTDLLFPVSTPKPEYPQEQLKKHHAGTVFANLTISAYGTIQQARIIASSHPEFTEAALRALVQWRYEPWEVAQGRPGSVDIAVPIIFGARGLEPFSKEVTVGLENTLCAYLNHEVKLSRNNFPQEPLSQVDVFWHTRQHLRGSYVAYRAPQLKQREALLAALENAIPAIVTGCKRNPDARYSSQLPAEVLAVLAAHP